MSEAPGVHFLVYIFWCTFFGLHFLHKLQSEMVVMQVSQALSIVDYLIVPDILFLVKVKIIFGKLCPSRVGVKIRVILF